MKLSTEAYKILRASISALKLTKIQKTKLLRQAAMAIDEANFRGFSTGVGLAEEILGRSIPQHERDELA